MKTCLAVWLSVFIGAALVVGVGQIVRAQEGGEKDKPPKAGGDEGDKPPAERRRPPGFGEGRDNRGGMRPGMMGGPLQMLQNMGVGIFANEKYVYVVKGNTLYQFKAEDLTLVNKATLEEAVPPAPPPPDQRGPQ